MNPNEVRLECLRLAAALLSRASAAEIVAAAEVLLAFVEKRKA